MIEDNSLPPVIPSMICKDCGKNVSDVQCKRLKWIPQFCKSCYRKRNYNYCGFICPVNKRQCTKKCEPDIPYCNIHADIYEDTSHLHFIRTSDRKPPHSPPPKREKEKARIVTEKSDYTCALEYFGMTEKPPNLKQLYHERALALHPDKNPDTDTTNEFQQLQFYYNILLNY